ncbi:hypothetical protein BU17DRAFT_74679 [Hysterangium stoloniferum]|nr:hypothetical protein BU17DRAFT_74679 [Hysterangium stoloniferum]
MSSGPTFRISQFAPANETLATVGQERMDIIGYILGAVDMVLHTRNSSYPLLRSTWFIIGSIGNGINCFDNQAEFVDNRDFPGGPEGYGASVTASFLNMFGATLYIINTWAQDGLLVCSQARVLMSCHYLASITHATTTFGSNLVNFGLAYWSLSIGTTIVLTLCIVGRLMSMRHRVKTVFGASQLQGSPYLSISAMFIESAFLYSFVGLITLVCFGKRFPALTLVLPLLRQVQSIAPLLIILRIAHGQALERDTFKNTKSDTMTPGISF